MMRFLSQLIVAFLIPQIALAGLPPTTTKAVGDSTNVTTFNFQFPNFAVTRSGITTIFGVNGIAGGGTGVSSVTTTPTASAFAGWDANQNMRANSFGPKITTTATAAGTTTLTVSSTQLQQFTGTTTQTVVMPDATTLVAGRIFEVMNRSTGVVTVNANGGGLLQTMVAGSQAIFSAVTVATSAGTWDVQYTVSALTASVPPTVQKFTSGSGTYTTPTGVSFIRVRMVGGGGGGGGSGNTTTGGVGGNGVDTTFGTSLLNAGGGSGGSTSTSNPSAGGTASLGTGPIGLALTGNQGKGGGQGPATTGGAGADAPYFNGGGSGGQMVGAGNAGQANTGGGGGGGGGPALSGNSGNGGSSGGFIEAFITSPSSTYAYAVGTGGTAGAAGTNGAVGSAGGSGYIEVTEYYTNLAVGTTTSVAAGTYFGGPYSGSNANPTFKAFQPPTIQKFTSSSGTYTKATGVLYIRVRMCGGGGGGAGSSTNSAANGGSGTNGGATTFGSSLLNAGGGAGAAALGSSGGAGGTASLGTGPVGTAALGGGGGAAAVIPSSGGAMIGGVGGNSGFGSGGYAGGIGSGGGNGGLCGGGGGGGGPNSNANGSIAGAGGGGGGFIDAIITSPSSSYAYCIGNSGGSCTGGTGGSAGTSGTGGGLGGPGYIEVTEYYQ